ncbi:MAG: alpha/beta hydrolase [Bryobacteraceae bacterium]
MKNSLLAYLVLFAVSVASAQTGIVGVWEGTLSAGPSKLRLQLHVRKDVKGNLTAALDSLDQGAMGLPASGVTLKDGAFHFDIPSVGGSYDGKFDERYGDIVGTWSQGGASIQLDFQRSRKPVALARPQTPVRPFPYIEQEVTFANKAAGITLAGTLTIPRGTGPFPAAVLISGSGPQDRDETIAGHKPFLVLSDHLTRQGIAVLRFDDRGKGKSTGNLATATMADFSGDAEAAVAYLRSRKDIQAAKIGLIGHSEGASVASMLAARLPMAFIVMMAPPGVRGEDLLLSQTAALMNGMGMPVEQIEKTVAFNKRAYAIARQESDPAAIDRKVREILPEVMGDQKPPEQVIKGQVKTLASPWFRHFLDYDPAPALKQLRCPALAMIGEKDMQVPADENVNTVRAALLAGGNKDVETVKLPGLNHLFQTAGTGLPMEYGQIEETMAPKALDLISGWILKRVR